MEVRRRVWNGKVPIKITVSEPESIGVQEYLIAGNRISYLWLYLPSILAYFSRYCNPSFNKNSEDSSWWLEFNEQPVPFNQPIGLLHDKMVGLPSSEPWELRLRKGIYPTTILALNDKESSLYTYWLNQLKESCYVRNGNARSVMAVSIADQNKLRQAIEGTTNPKVDTSHEFWSLASSLIDKPGELDRIPLRLYIGSRVIQKTPSQAQALNEVLTPLVDEKREYQILCHGVEISDITRCGELYSLMTYPDGFLHLVVKSSDPSDKKI